eukprot:6208041-Pleurochrysis_carterae.AAC.2
MTCVDHEDSVVNSDRRFGNVRCKDDLGTQPRARDRQGRLRPPRHSSCLIRQDSVTDASKYASIDASNTARQCNCPASCRSSKKEVVRTDRLRTKMSATHKRREGRKRREQADEKKERERARATVFGNE